MPRIDLSVWAANETFSGGVRRPSTRFLLPGVVPFVFTQFVVLEPWFGVPFLVVAVLLGGTNVLFGGTVILLRAEFLARRLRPPVNGAASLSFRYIRGVGQAPR
jgi:hypothetical protein